MSDYGLEPADVNYVESTVVHVCKCGFDGKADVTFINPAFAIGNCPNCDTEFEVED